MTITKSLFLDYLSTILPYGIEPDTIIDCLSTKPQFKDKFLSLKDEYLKLLDEYKWNDLVYRSKYNFEPVIGETYHLYDNDKGEMFLSLIEPHEWNRICIGSFKLNHENKWIKIKK